METLMIEPVGDLKVKIHFSPTKHENNDFGASVLPPIAELMKATPGTQQGLIVPPTSLFVENDNPAEVFTQTDLSIDQSNAYDTIGKNVSVPKVEGTGKGIYKRKGLGQNRKLPGRKVEKETDKYRCKYCGKLFTIKWNLKTHERIHTGEKPFPCQKCDQAFRQFAHLQKHFRFLHSENISPKRTFTQKTPREISSAKPRIVKPLSSTKKVFPSKVLNKTEEKTIQECEIKLDRVDLDCTQSLNSTLLSQKLNSMVANSPSKDLLLQVPGAGGEKCFVDVDSDLIFHFLKPLPVDQPAAESSTSGYSSSSSVTLSSPSSRQQSPLHMDLYDSVQNPLQLQTNSRPGPKSKTINLTAQRMAKEQMGDATIKVKFERKLKCKKCKRRFPSQISLNAHFLRFHSNMSSTTPFKQKDVAGESVTEQIVDKSQKEASISPSKTKKPRSGNLECSVCKRTFLRLDVLKKHMQLHDQVNPKNSVQCAECHKFFSSRNYLVVHMRSHTGEKPYECTICQQKFAQSGTLQIHMRQHTGEKPYKCDKCDQEFSQKCSFEIHKSRQHGEGHLKCRICGEEFTDLNTLKVHTASSH